jgi:hypothetical protein
MMESVKLVQLDLYVRLPHRDLETLLDPVDQDHPEQCHLDPEDHLVLADLYLETLETLRSRYSLLYP